MKMDEHVIGLQLCIFLVLCTKAETAVSNVALHKSVFSSTKFPHAGYKPGNAVDGVIKQTHTDTCNCCAATNNLNSPNPWFKVDLGATYMVHNLSVYGREPYNTTDIVLHNGNDSIEKSTLTINEHTNTFHHKFKSPVNTRYVTVRYRGIRDVFVLCEIQVFGKCLPGRCGSDCSDVCHCRDVTSGVYRMAGVCPNGCEGRWTGPDKRCDHECTTTQWGPFCNKTCGYCHGNQACDVENGHCPSGCVRDWKPPLCDECTNSQWGPFCNKTCGSCYGNQRCDVRNGHCPSGCVWPWKPTLCDEPDDLFGALTIVIWTLAAIVIIVDIALIICIRRRSSENEKDDGTPLKLLNANNLRDKQPNDTICEIPVHTISRFRDLNLQTCSGNTNISRANAVADISPNISLHGWNNTRPSLRGDLGDSGASEDRLVRVRCALPIEPHCHHPNLAGAISVMP